jgi:septum formation protein
MPQRFILASGSSIRSQLLQQACVPHEVSVARIDEQMIKSALLAEQAPPPRHRRYTGRDESPQGQR